MSPRTYHITSLGCAKNTVDSESMAQLLGESGFKRIKRLDEADILIVNTCGFIGPAQQESLQVLAEMAAHKKNGQLLVAAGCLTQRFASEVVRAVPGIDGILSTRRWMDILDVVEQLRNNRHPKPIYHLPDVATVGKDERGVSRVAIQGASAYLKIADGCRRPCAFCAIPLIKGQAVSRPMEAIIEEARALQAAGIHEIILIAQDTTDYGHDIGLKDGLAELLENLVAAVPQVDWIRILYAYPGYVTDRLIDVMVNHPQVIPYLDMPLQHAHPQALRRMRRPANIDWVHRTIEKLRSVLPDIVLRTTFIVGYPGETDKEFKTLLDFVEEVQFDHVGTFQFSFEPGTASESFGDTVPQEVKQERYDRLMSLQQQISLTRSQTFVGRTLDVIVEGQSEGITLARSYRDAPEVDGFVIIEGDAALGEFIQVRITGAMPYDLTGVIIKSTS